MQNKNKAAMLKKNKRLSKVCLMYIKTGQFIKLYKVILNYVKSNIFFFACNRDDFGIQSSIYGGTFFAKKINS